MITYNVDYKTHVMTKTLISIFGSKKRGNPKECFYVIILGVEMPSGHLAFLHINIGQRDAW
jgi:hypothetical protein